MGEEDVLLYLAVYDSREDAKEDLEAVHELYAAGGLKTYDAAIVDKTDDGKVHVVKREKPSQAGALGGASVGALLSILFPPGILAFGVVGAAAGGLIGHLWKGMSRGDIKEMGEVLDDGEAALIVIAETAFEEVIEKATKKASKQIAKEIKADKKELEKAIEEADKEWEKENK
ncbi:MAG: DUF1269 domain-containing protein [Actinobacteria bacterium]|nr:DUF1269 domain-containing protein [Actinomycetota bacterium]